MAEITRVDPNAPGVIADRDMYLADDEYTIVEKGDPKARYLLAARGSFIDAPAIARLGLAAKGGKVVQGKGEGEGAPDEKTKLMGAQVNEGQIRPAGEPLILAPRTGVMRGEMFEREIPKPGDEVPIAPKTIAVSNVPKEDDELRARVAKETAKEGEKEKAAAQPAARKSTAKKSGVRRRPAKGR